MFNEIVLKATVTLAQISRIQEYSNGRFMEKTGKGESEYYLHLTYPPKYYISLLKPELASDDGFIRNWDRVENFIFLRNKDIMQN